MNVIQMLKNSTYWSRWILGKVLTPINKSLLEDI